MYRKYETAFAAVESALDDVRSDFGAEAADDFGVYYDLVINIAADCTPAVAAELTRRELGIIYESPTSVIVESQTRTPAMEKAVTERVARNRQAARNYHKNDWSN